MINISIIYVILYKREEYDKQIEIEKRRVLIETENLKEKYKKLQEQNQILQNQLSNLNMGDNNNTYEVSNRREEINYNNLEIIQQNLVKVKRFGKFFLFEKCVFEGLNYFICLYIVSKSRYLP